MISTFSRWRGSAVIVAALGTMLAWLSLSDATPARADSPPGTASPPGMTPQPDCGSRFVILSVRGTTESTNGDPFGDTHINSVYINAVTDALVNNEHVRADDITADNVPYPATAIFDPSTMTDYDGSVRRGVENLTDDISRYRTCNGPNHPTLILIGYSQGAHVVKQTLNNIASSPDADNIGAAIDVADASRLNGQNAGQMFTVNSDWTPAPEPAPGTGGLMDRLPVPGPFADRYFDICRTDDVVCNDAHLPRDPSDLAAFGVRSQFPAHFPHIHYSDIEARGDANLIGEHAASAAEARFNKLNPPPPPPNSTPPMNNTPPASTPPTPPAASNPPAGTPPTPPASTPPVNVPIPSTPPVSPAPPGSSLLPVPPVSNLPSLMNPGSPALPGSPPLPVPPVNNPVPPVAAPPPPPPMKKPPRGSVPPPPPDQGVPGPTVHQENAKGRRMNVRRFATTDAKVVAVLRGPTEVDVQCQVRGQRVVYKRFDNDGWAYLPAFGGWVSDIFISGNRMVPHVPSCHSTKAPRMRADVPPAVVPKPVIPAPEVLRPVQSVMPPPGTPQLPSLPVPTPAPEQPQGPLNLGGLLP